MCKQINEWSRECLNCQQSKIHKHTKSPVIKIPIPKGRFEHIHLDIVGPLPPSNGHRYLLTVIDRFTRWPEVYPLRDINSKTVVDTFVRNYISRFGVPLKITTDQGTQFTSHMFSELSKFLGSHKIATSSYHPQANGMVERFHRQIKATLMAKNGASKWYDELPIALLGLRSIYKEDLGATPAEMTYGQNVRLPGEIIVQGTQYDASDVLFKLKDHFGNVRSNIIHHTDPESDFYIPNDLRSCKYVFLRVINKRSLQQPYEGPFKVVEKDKKCFRIEKNGEIIVVPIDRLKPAITEKPLHTTKLNTNISTYKSKHVTFNLLDLNVFSEGK